MSCNGKCDGKCDGKCEKCSGGGGAGGCKGGRDRGRRRMAEWRECEPFCGGGCVTACGGVRYFPDGKRCDPSCQKWGPHANQSRRDPDISPADGAAIESAFGYEVLTTTLLYELPGFPGWYFVPLGSLGLSHQFCLREASATVAVADEPTPLPITNVRLAGGRIACDNESQGSYVWVIDRSVGADPDAIEITDGRCACTSLCAWTPSRGLEFFLFEYAQPPMQGGVVETTLKIERCDWLVEVDPCVQPVGNRVRYSDVAVPSPIIPVRRVQPGKIPFVP